MKLRSLAVPGLGLVTALTLAVVPASAEDRDGSAAPTSTRAATPSFSTDEAVAALAAVEAIFVPTPGGARARARAPRSDVDATLALRDLAVSARQLSSQDRATAERLLARPVAGQTSGVDRGAINGVLTSECPSGKTYCVHHTTTAPAPGTRDDRASGSDVRATKAVLDKVTKKYAGARLRTPLRDTGNGSAAGNPNSRIDVYLMNLRPYGLYGYCANEGTLPAGTYVAPVYCVLDNDFADYGQSPGAARKVTVAHEYFHAVQAAYDWLEDAWFMEGMAAWAEDEVYDGVNDNLQYLKGSQLTVTRLPLDYFDDHLASSEHKSLMSRYGSWVFFRYLSEQWQKKTKKKAQRKPLVMAREIFERAAAAHGPDDHSLKAIAHVVNKNKRVYKGGFARTYNGFAVANQRTKRSYSEGRSYPSAKPIVTNLRKRTKKVRTLKSWDRIPHLSSYTVRLVPHKSYQARTKVKIAFKLPKKAANPGVTVRAFKKNGKVKSTTWVKLNKRGKATRTFAFSRKNLKFLEVTVSNGSVSSRCWQGQVDDPYVPGSQPFAWSCYGHPSHDGLRHKFTATVRR